MSLKATRDRGDQLERPGIVPETLVALMTDH
jgi:hypothetical protein